MWYGLKTGLSKLGIFGKKRTKEDDQVEVLAATYKGFAQTIELSIPLYPGSARSVHGVPVYPRLGKEGINRVSRMAQDGVPQDSQVAFLVAEFYGLWYIQQ